MSRPLQILLLGGSGFVGRALLGELAARPAGSVRVRALLRRPEAVPDHPALDKVAGSLEALPRDLEPTGPYVLVHYAVKQVDADGTGYLAVNVEATERLLRSLRGRIMGVIYSSTMSVYGQGAQDGIDETTAPNPQTALAHSRRFAEARIEVFAHERNVSALLLRPRFVLGEGDRFVLPAVEKLVRRRVGISSGAQRFSVIDVADYARVIVRLAEQVAARHEARDPIRQPLHVGHAQPVSFTQITDALRSARGLPPARWRVPVSPAVTRLLGHVPLAATDALATRLSLIGLSHWGSTDALAAAIGDDIVGKDPMVTVRRAAERLNG